MAWRGLTTHQGDAIRVHLPEPTVSARGGRPRVEDRRGVEGILWMLWTGAPWGELPRRYGRSQHLLATAEGLGRAGGAPQALASVLSPAERPAETTRG